MWERRTFHECALELDALSVDFRSAFTNRFGWDDTRKAQVLADSSKRGREVLQILALSVRGEQDIGLVGTSSAPVGSLSVGVTEEEQRAVPSHYRPPFTQLHGSTPLTLREALNKIAHHDPQRSSFYADEDTHDLILVGKDQRGSRWIGILSLIELAGVIRSLPDAKTLQPNSR